MVIVSKRNDKKVKGIVLSLELIRIGFQFLRNQKTFEPLYYT